MSIEGQGHIFSIYFPGFLCFVLYLAKISGERLQDHWSSGCWTWSEILTTRLIKALSLGCLTRSQTSKTGFLETWLINSLSGGRSRLNLV